jgi:UDP-hydrolysing UDP-N-acetyl-D-glucosamine 2-epimerase
MKKKICFISSSRADFGIMRNLISLVNNQKYFDVSLILTGSHLSKKFGLTKNEVSKYFIGKKYFIKTSDKINKNKDILNISSKILKDINLILAKNKFDLCILLGDRYEVFQICFALFNYKVPILHIGGGDITIGSQDNVYRNSISLMSSYHFVTNKGSQTNLKKIGISGSKIFNFGHLALDNLSEEKYLSKKELSNKYGLDFSKKNFLVTFHPETDKKIDPAIIYLKRLIIIAKGLKDVNFIFTSSNFDLGGVKINNLAKKVCKTTSNFFYVSSFGQKDLFSLYKHLNGVIGNSSSGIFEAPSFNIPTLNIGSRQKGRIYSRSIINSNGYYSDLYKKLYKILKINFKNTKIINVYKKDKTLKNFLNKIKKISNIL